MFNLYKNSIIYVLAPAGLKTGGPELAHQLVYELNHAKTKEDVKIYITYYNIESYKKEEYTDRSFKKYITAFKTISDIVDDPHNVIIVPETCTEILNYFKNIQKSIFWMSVDNYALNHSFFFNAKINGWPKAIKRLLSGKIKVFTRIDRSIVHFYQSEYAKDYLAKHGVKRLYPLSDYINESYLSEYKDKSERKNIVLYNPKKGLKFTRKIIKKCQDVEFVPLINLTNEEVKQLLKTSKIYIDFGNHPGKDRFPREAAISGCIVITNRRGSANFYNDIPIKDFYKIKDKVSNLQTISDRIHFCINEYKTCLKDFESYKQSIRKERSSFKKEVEDILKD